MASVHLALYNLEGKYTVILVTHKPMPSNGPITKSHKSVRVFIILTVNILLEANDLFDF